MRLSDDFTGLLPFADGETYRDITPEGYVEGPFMLCRDGRYYFMWSEGGDRVVCIDRLEFDEDGNIIPVKMS